jgi:hypothetical protein
MPQQPKKPNRSEERSKPTIAKNPLTYTLLVLFLVLSIVAFVWVPAANRGGLGGQVIFGSYAGKEIDYKPGNYLARMVDQINRQKQDADSSSEAALYFRAYEVWREAFEQVAIRLAMLHSAKKAGNAVSQERLNREMRDLAQFKDEKGNFSLKLFRETSEAARAKLMDSLKEDLLVQDFLDGAVDLASSPAEKDFLRAMNRRMRSFTYAAIPFSSYPDSEVVAYGKAKPELFRHVRLSYVFTMGAKAELEKLRKKIIDGTETFSGVLANGSQDFSGAEDVLREAWELEEYFKEADRAKTVMGLAEGEISQVMKAGDGGWVFYKCIKAAQDPDFSDQDTVSRVWSYVNGHEKGLIEEYVSKRAQDFRAAAALDFGKACTQFGVSPKKLEAFPINYGAMPLLQQPSFADAPELASVSTNEEFFTAAFSIKAGELSEPLIIGENAIVLKLDGESEADDSANFTIDYYFDMYLGQYTDSQLRQSFLESPLFKDNFSEIFQKRIMPYENG